MHSADEPLLTGRGRALSSPPPILWTMATTTQRRPVVRQKSKGPIDPAFGLRFKALREARGLTQDELAGTDFSKAFISHIETGRTRVSLRAAEILARRLGVRVVDLMGSDARPAEAELAAVTAERALALGRPEDALSAVSNSIRSARGIERARLRRLEGRALTRLGRAREAIAPLTEALRALTAAGDKELRTRAAYDLAYAHASLDETGEALGLLVECERALESGDVVDRTLELQTHSLLAGIFAHLGDHGSAELQSERAAKLAEDVVDVTALDTLYATMITTRRERGDLEGALVYARKALQLHEREGRESEAVHAWNNLACIHIERGHFERAETALARAERLKQESGRSAGHLIVTRARLELARKRPDAALALAGEAERDKDLSASSRAQAGLIAARALALKKGPTARIRAAFERALEMHAAQPPARRARAHEQYASFLAAKGQYAEAYRHARSALSLRRASLVE